MYLDNIGFVTKDLPTLDLSPKLRYFSLPKILIYWIQPFKKVNWFIFKFCREFSISLLKILPTYFWWIAIPFQDLGDVFKISAAYSLVI